MSAAETREALKPCPFCGGADIRRDDHGLPVSFACEDCGARGGASEEDVSEAADFWNRRAPLPDEEGMVERVARLEAALRQIAEYQPSFDYVGRDDYGIRTDFPGSPYDRGKADASKHLSAIAIRAINGGKP